MSMRIIDGLILVVLLCLLGIGIYFIWLNLPAEPVKYERFYLNYSANTSEDIVVDSYYNLSQFYPNMRYKDRVISYEISGSCDIAKRKDAERAFSFLREKTVLDFIPAMNDEKGEISVLCSNVSPKPEEEGHFVAGEGGPSEIINTSKYAVILSGKVSLYRRTSECVRPNIAIHEILHALGFDHNNNPNSVMYPVTECEQELDNYIINEINKIYRTESASDLAVERVDAVKSGRYLSFEIVIGNFGLQNSKYAKLVILDEEVVKEFDLGEIEIGTRKILNVENLRISRNSKSLIFDVKTNEKELDKKNNVAEVRIMES